MFLFYVLSFFKNGDIIQGGTLFKGGHYLRRYGTYSVYCGEFFLFDNLGILTLKFLLYCRTGIRTGTYNRHFRVLSFPL